MPLILRRMAVRWGRHSGFISLSDQAISSGTNFVTGVVIGRSCAPEEFGLYLLGLSLLVFATDLQGSLITTPFIVHSPRLTGEARARYAGSTLLHQLSLSLLAVMVFLGGGIVVSGAGESRLETALYALAVTGSFYLLRDFARQVSFATLRMRSALILDSIVCLLQISGLLFLAAVGQLTIPRAYLIVGLATGVAALGWLSAHRDQFLLRPDQAMADFKRNWHWGKWIVGSGILWGLGFHLYPWLITFFHDARVTGEWAACLGTAGLCNVPLMAVHNYLGPRIAKVQAERGLTALKRFVHRSAILYSFVLFLLCSVVLFFGGRLVVLFYGTEYRGNGEVVALLTLNTVVAPTTFVFSRGLFALDRAKLDCGIAGIQFVVVLLAGIGLVRSLGPLGAAMGVLISTAIATLARGVAFQRVWAHRSKSGG